MRNFLVHMYFHSRVLKPFSFRFKQFVFKVKILSIFENSDETLTLMSLKRPIFKSLANSADQYAASDQGLHCLLKQISM